MVVGMSYRHGVQMELIGGELQIELGDCVRVWEWELGSERCI